MNHIAANLADPVLADLQAIPAHVDGDMQYLAP